LYEGVVLMLKKLLYLEEGVHLALGEEVLGSLGWDAGTVLQVCMKEGALVITSVSEEEREALLFERAQGLMEKYTSAFEELAR
jgi:hypothetical protein